MFTIEDTQGGEYTGDDRIINAVVAFNPPTSEETGHIVLKDDEKFSINTEDGITDGLLLGTMSFQMTEEIFDTSWFSLVESSNSPKTGIKISIDSTYHYEAQSTFRFTDAVNSDNANLKDLVVSHGILDTENPDNSTYKEYVLTPEFDGAMQKQYEMELLEYIDDIDITATVADETSTMVMKVPKRDEENNLVYEEDGTTIVYEEKTIINNVPINVILNKLGEPDTIITIAVTTENGKASEEYTLTIKRPFATIKGQAILANFDDESIVQDVLDNYGVQVNNKVDINLYKPDLAEWESITDIYQLIYENPFTYEKLEGIPKETTGSSEDDGTFEIYVIPGKYDLQVTRLGYLDYIYSDVEINKGEIIDMEKFNMPAGDANRDGIITLEDLTILTQFQDMDSANPEFLESYNPIQTGVIMLEDLTYATQNQDKQLKIEYFSTH